MKTKVIVHSKGFFGDKVIGQAILGLDLYF